MWWLSSAYCHLMSCPHCTDLTCETTTMTAPENQAESTTNKCHLSSFNTAAQVHVHCCVLYHCDHTARIFPWPSPCLLLFCFVFYQRSTNDRSLIWKIPSGDISAMGHPIHFMCGSMVWFSGWQIEWHYFRMDQIQ